jgi:hypothetical protein
MVLHSRVKPVAKSSRNRGAFRPAIKRDRPPAEDPDMMRAISGLFASVFLAASGKTAQTLTSDGDTAMIMLQTLLCVVLLSLAVYCKNQRRAEMD